MTKKDVERSSDVSPQKDSRDAVESAIERAKGDRKITWEAAIGRTHKKISKWEDSETASKRKRTAAA